MANKKFSEFELKTSTSDVSHIVGYNGTENVQITPANFLDTTGGPYLPLAGGTMTGTNGVVFPDNFYLNLGTSSDFEIYHDGNNSYLKDQGTGELILASNGTGIKLEKTSGEKMIHALTDGAVELYYDSVKKFETTLLGATVTGDLLVTGTITGVGGSYLPLAGGTMSGNIKFNDSVEARFGNGADLRIYHDGSDSYINEIGIGNLLINADNLRLRDTSGNPYFLGNTGAEVSLYYNGSTKLQTTSTGISVTGDVDLLAGNKLKFSANSYITPENNTSGAEISTGGTFIVKTGSTPTLALTLDASGNLGVGTSTPSEKLTVESGGGFIATFKSLTASDFRPIRFQNAAGSDVGYIGNNDSTDEFSLNANDQPLVFGSGAGGLEKMRLDTNGNLGVGTSTPNANLETTKAITFINSDTIGQFLIKSAAGSTGDMLNFGVDSANSLAFIQANEKGVNTIPLVLQRYGGNLGVGTSTPSAKLDVYGDIKLGTTANSNILNRSDSHWVQYNGGATTNNTYIRVASVSAAGISKTISFHTDASERMRLDASGNLGIGTAAPSTKLSISQVANGNIASFTNTVDADFFINLTSGVTLLAPSTGVLAFGTGSTERMRLDASGILQKNGDNATARIIPETDGAGYIGESSHRWNALFAVVGTIQTSDVREKTNIKTTQLGLDFVNDLNPVSYKWIKNERLDSTKDERNHQGLIAQEVAKTLEKHGIDKNDFGGLDIQKTDKYDDFHGMSYDQLLAPMIKAIQELTAKVEKLELNK